MRPGQKESTRWIEGYERVAEMAARVPSSRLVYVADREGTTLANVVGKAMAIDGAILLFRCQNAEIAEALMQCMDGLYELTMVKEPVHRETTDPLSMGVFRWPPRAQAILEQQTVSSERGKRCQE